MIWWKSKLSCQIRSVTEHLTPKITSAWQYAKFEMAPPLTIGFFYGPTVRKLEDYCSNTANNFKAGLRQQIKEIDAEEERVRKEKEAAAAKAEEEYMEASEAEAEKPEEPPKKK
ncbi:hypothetical protein O3G_MSEX014489 [Manduca sexta]|uniref:Uncharacterized protein n=1 Tax=Manduca sexta TaxID=7130 RepID=A0A922D044_MANSE|nr:hypothetical protein O3G_MSEX014489 [Manduca sexta]